MEDDPKRQLGKILLQQKLVSQDELSDLLAEQERVPGTRLASAAARLGRVSMRDALHALSEQHGIPGIDLTAEVIPVAILRLLPEDIARERVALPFALSDAGLHVAMSSPDDGEALEEVGFVSGKTIIAHVALDWVLQHVIEQAYAAEAKGMEYFVARA